MRVIRVLAPNPGVYTLDGTNTWVLGTGSRENLLSDDGVRSHAGAGSGVSIVIDPGPDDAGHREEILREAGRVVAILLTHQHEDHAPGAAALAEATGSPAYAFRPKGVGERLHDGRTVRAGGVAVTTVHTPGHSRDHVAFFVEQTGALFTGDAVLGRGTSVIDPPEGDLATYLRSLRRMRELRPKTIYPGHGPVVFDAAGKLEEYAAHRAEREEQVVAGLAEGPRTIDELVTEIYAAYPEEVRPLAARSVLAHLKKLEAEGRADHTGRGRSIRYSLGVPRVCERCGRPVRGRAKLCDRCRLAVLQERPDA